MTAMVAERPAAAVAPLPAADRLSERQLLGIDCARCGAYLGVHALRLGRIEDHGCELTLFGCAPACRRRLPRRVPGRTPPAHATEPPWRNTPLGRLPRWTAAPSMPDPLDEIELPDDYDTDPATLRRIVAGLHSLPDAAPAAPP